MDEGLDDPSAVLTAVDAGAQLWLIGGGVAAFVVALVVAALVWRRARR